MIIKTWKIWGRGLPPIYIIDNDADKALRQARLINDRYDTYQLYSIEKKDP